MKTSVLIDLKVTQSMYAKFYSVAFFHIVVYQTFYRWMEGNGFLNLNSIIAEIETCYPALQFCNISKN